MCAHQRTVSIAETLTAGGQRVLQAVHEQHPRARQGLGLGEGDVVEAPEHLGSPQCASPAHQHSRAIGSAR